MNPYIEDTKDAVQHLVGGIFREHEKLEGLASELKKAMGYASNLARMANSAELNPDLDDEGIGTWAHWEYQFEGLKGIDQAQAKIDRVKQSIVDRKISIGALSAGLLQIAKQGISTTHGSLTKCPDGRKIGTQVLKDVIWQGRNQAMHYEEGRLHDPVKLCFETLAVDLGNPTFRNYLSDNLAFEVIQALGWRSDADVERDLTSLLPP